MNLVLETMPNQDRRPLVVIVGAEGTACIGRRDRPHAIQTKPQESSAAPLVSTGVWLAAARTPPAPPSLRPAKLGYARMNSGR